MVFFERNQEGNRRQRTMKTIEYQYKGKKKERKKEI
jgi:hypothetical protein